MTGSWLTLSAAASRIAAATGEPTSVDDVLELGRQDLLIVVWQHEHHSVLEESVADYLYSHGSPTLPADIEDEYRREKDT